MKRVNLIGLLVGLLLGTLVSIGILFFSIPTFATVDPSQMIKFIAQDLAVHFEGKVSPEQLQVTAQELRTKVAKFAKKKRVILLNRDLVWSYLPDLTPQILAYLKNEHKK